MNTAKSKQFGLSDASCVYTSGDGNPTSRCGSERSDTTRLALDSIRLTTVRRRRKDADTMGYIEVYGICSRAYKHSFSTLVKEQDLELVFN